MYNKQRGERYETRLWGNTERNDKDDAIVLKIMRRYGNKQSKIAKRCVKHLTPTSISSIGRLSTFPNHLGIETILLVCIILDYTSGTVRLQEGVLAFHGIPIARFKLLFLVSCLWVRNAVSKFVFRRRCLEELEINQ